jgi:hypothetical protein
MTINKYKALNLIPYSLFPIPYSLFPAIFLKPNMAEISYLVTAE